MSNDEHQRTEKGNTTPSKRKCSFDSQNSLCGLRGARSVVYSENWDEEESQGYVISTNHKILRDIQKSIVVNSKRFLEGWSPTCNFTTEAFFKNYQSDFISWTQQWPSTRIPRSHTTDTSDLVGCLIIEVDLEVESEIAVNESPRKIVLLEPTFVAELTRAARKPSNSAFDKNAINNIPIIFRSIEHQRNLDIEDNYVIDRKKEAEDKGPPIQQRFRLKHNKGAFNRFHHLLNEQAYDQSEQQQEEDYLRLIDQYTTYVNDKGRCLSHVNKNSIDKTSPNYIPNSKSFELHPNYSVKILDNTFDNHIIGTVGFTVAEYFGGTLVEDIIGWYVVPIVHVKDNDYNIVQTVHGYRFTRTGRAIPHHGRVVLPPNINNHPNFARQKKRYRLYRLYLGTLKINNYKVYRYLYPLAFDPNRSNFNSINPYRPINVRKEIKEINKIRYWYFKQLLRWTQYGDLTDITDHSYPAFQTDFYKVKYLMPREE